jgi:hypothetical protein
MNMEIEMVVTTVTSRSKEIVSTTLLVNGYIDCNIVATMKRNTDDFIMSFVPDLADDDILAFIHEAKKMLK